jgi:type I restriction enzyme S subunit
VPLIRGCNLTKGEAFFVEDGFVFITEEKAEELKSCVALSDDLIFTAAGTLGQVGLIPKDCRHPKYVISNKQLRARVDIDKASPLFLFYWFSSPVVQRLIEQRRSGSSIPVINLSILRSLPIPRPDLKEQTEIADAITAVNTKIAIHRKKKTILEELFQTLLHQLMTAQIRVNDLDTGELETDIME